MIETPTFRPKTAFSVACTLLLGLALPACAGADSATSGAEAPQAASANAVAEVGGQLVTYGEIGGLLEPQSRRSFRQALDIAVEEVIVRKLYELEAAARKVTVEDLLQAEIAAKAGAITEEEINGFYEENQARINRPLAEIRPQLEQYLVQTKQVERRDAFLSELRTRYQAKNLLPIERVDVAEAGAPSKGPAGAPVTIIEFSDFECPFCARVLPSIEQTLATYGDQVRLVFRQFPLNIHPRAPKAAEASLCAADQGKFWEMHDAMFAKQNELEVAQLKATAAGLGLDAAAFDACLDGGAKTAQVQEDSNAALAAGATGTPALFVNGRFLNGAVPFEQIEKIVDDELARKGITPKKAAAAE